MKNLREEVAVKPGQPRPLEGPFPDRNLENLLKKRDVQSPLAAKTKAKAKAEAKVKAKALAKAGKFTQRQPEGQLLFMVRSLPSLEKKRADPQWVAEKLRIRRPDQDLSCLELKVKGQVVFLTLLFPSCADEMCHFKSPDTLKIRPIMLKFLISSLFSLLFIY
jgi:hypothetical protein